MPAERRAPRAPAPGRPLRVARLRAGLALLAGCVTLVPALVLAAPQTAGAAYPDNPAQPVNFGDAGFFGPDGGLQLNAPDVGMASTPSGHGYWIMLGNGKVYAFGDAVNFGVFAPKGGANFVDVVAGSTNGGYTLVAKSGKTYGFGTDIPAAIHLGVKAPVAASTFGAGFVVTDGAGKTALSGSITGCGNLGIKTATRIVGIATTT